VAKGALIAQLRPDEFEARLKMLQGLGGEVETMEGLAPGDRIVVVGVTFLREGMQVRDLAGALGGA
jgi:hypothetical protein